MAKSYAKINLVLLVFPKTHERLHRVYSIANKISLYDEVTVKLNEQNTINISCNKKDVPLDERNTVYKVLKALNKFANIEQGFDVNIIKNIPLQAGLGGGSSNAATALLEACKLLGVHYDFESLVKIVKGVGSDIPQFFYNSTVLIESEGDKVAPVPNNLKDYIVIVKPPFGVSSKDAYEIYDKIGFDGNIDESLLEDLAKNRYEAAITKMSNDLEYPVLEYKPELKKLKAEMYRQSLDFVMLSGSGSTFFGLTRDKAKAKNVVEYFKAQNYFAKVVEKIF